MTAREAERGSWERDEANLFPARAREKRFDYQVKVGLLPDVTVGLLLNTDWKNLVGLLCGYSVAGEHFHPMHKF